MATKEYEMDILLLGQSGVGTSAMPTKKSEMNILLLGQSGVGKTTFINSIKNFVSYSTFDEAMDGPLQIATPSSFDVHNKAEGKMVNVIVGGASSEDESLNNIGEAATRRCMVRVFPIEIEDICGSTIRIIDTPGIGDGRGTEKDMENFQEVLSDLESLQYQQIHGICILLKPNEARLSILMEYCITELLTHLHRNAASNVVFCFTNTRGTDYQVGDTFRPLHKLVKDLEDRGTVIPLSPDTIYCFDNESFRFLAARKQGVSLNESGARESWVHSSRECARLFQHFANTTAHVMEETLCLNKVKQIVTNLDEPMRKLSANIDKNLKTIAQHKELISNYNAGRQGLEKLLQLERKVIRYVELLHSRTVCVSPKCVTYVLAEDGGPGEVVHCNPCHSHCWLNENGWFGTYWCKEINIMGKCKKCGCKFRDHMFVSYDTIEETVQEVDLEVKELLDKVDNVTVIKKKLLENVMKEQDDLLKENQYVNAAFLKFASFLKKNSIKASSDSKVKYMQYEIRVLDDKLDGQIEDEAQRHAWREKVIELKKHLEEHEEEVRKYELFLESGDNQQLLSVERIQLVIDGLYKLKYSGPILQNAAKVVRQAQKARRREIVHVVKSDEAKSWMFQLFKTAQSGLTAAQSGFKKKIKHMIK